MGYDLNPYQAYTDGSIYSDNPINLVVALYQGALDATRQAESAVHARDILGRTKAINKAISILTELLVSLNMEHGGEISQNLKRLYCYMQEQLIKANMQQTTEPLSEVAKLLTTLLEAWREVVKSEASRADKVPFSSAYSSGRDEATQIPYVSASVYGGYSDDALAGRASTAYSF